MIAGDLIIAEVPCPYCYKEGIEGGIPFIVCCNRFYYVRKKGKKVVVYCIGCKTIQMLEGSYQIFKARN